MSKHVENLERYLLSVYAEAFTEWDRRYREEPERFNTEWQETMTTEQYGETAAAYLLRLIQEQVTAE